MENFSAVEQELIKRMSCSLFCFLTSLDFNFFSRSPCYEMMSSLNWAVRSLLISSRSLASSFDFSRMLSSYSVMTSQNSFASAWLRSLWAFNYSGSNTSLSGKQASPYLLTSSIMTCITSAACLHEITTWILGSWSRYASVRVISSIEFWAKVSLREDTDLFSMFCAIHVVMSMKRQSAFPITSRAFESLYMSFCFKIIFYELKLTMVACIATVKPSGSSATSIVIMTIIYCMDNYILVSKSICPSTAAALNILWMK